MRATRAYLAGFGTAGSLLAGAAMLFVLASAVVAVRGWPQIDYHSSAASLTLAAPKTPSKATLAAPTVTRHAAVHAALTGSATRLASAAATPTATRTHVQPASPAQGLSGAPGTSAPRHQTPAPTPSRGTSSAAPTSTASAPCSSCSTGTSTTTATGGSSSPPNLADTLNNVVQGAANTVQNTTQNLTSTVNQVVNGLP